MIPRREESVNRDAALRQSRDTRHRREKALSEGTRAAEALQHYLTGISGRCRSVSPYPAGIVGASWDRSVAISTLAPCEARQTYRVGRRPVAVR
jgi:hypothetical protein